MTEQEIIKRLRRLERRVCCLSTLTTSTTPDDPEPGTAVEWFDGTNKRYIKNVNGVITSGVIY